MTGGKNLPRYVELMIELLESQGTRRDDVFRAFGEGDLWWW